VKQNIFGLLFYFSFISLCANIFARNKFHAFIKDILLHKEDKRRCAKEKTSKFFLIYSHFLLFVYRLSREINFTPTSKTFYCTKRLWDATLKRKPVSFSSFTLTFFSLWIGFRAK